MASKLVLQYKIWTWIEKARLLINRKDGANFLKIYLWNILNPKRFKSRIAIFFIFLVIFTILIRKLIFENKISLYNYPKSCSEIDLFHDYNIKKNIFEREFYLSSKGFSGIPFECPTKYLEKKYIMKENLYKNHSYSNLLKNGGLHIPKNCSVSKSVAIIVPYRNRPKQLKIFLENIHKFLTLQNIYYQIFIIEQSQGRLFNRGFLINVGVLESLKIHNFDCFVFHDVDRLPKYLINRYDCMNSPRHMSVQTEPNIFMPLYNLYAGGVTSIYTDHFLLVNGFSNIYWGWGGEDDDFYVRLNYFGFEMRRVHPCVGQYNFIKTQHVSQYRYDFVAEAVLKTSVSRIEEEGVKQAKYNVLNYHQDILSTHITVDILNEDRVYFAYVYYFQIRVIISYFGILILLNFIAHHLDQLIRPRKRSIV